MIAQEEKFLIDMEFRDAPVGDVYHVLGELAGLNVLVDASVKGTISLYLKELTIESALELISKTTGFRYVIEEKTLIVATAERLRQEFAAEEFEFMYLKNVSVNEAKQLLQVIIPEIKTYVDSERNLIVLHGLKNDLERGISLLEKYDSGETMSAPFITASEEQSSSVQTRAITVSYANGNEILQLVKKLYPDRYFEWDGKLGLLFGRTTAAEWEHVVKVVNQKDIPEFIIRGIVIAEVSRVLLEYQGETKLVAEGEKFHDWLLTSIEGKEVVFSQGNREFTVTMRR